MERRPGETTASYAIYMDDVIFRLPAGGPVIQNDGPFLPGSGEHAIHSRPLQERLGILSQLKSIFLTKAEQDVILAWTGLYLAACRTTAAGLSIPAEKQ